MRVAAIIVAAAAAGCAGGPRRGAAASAPCGAPPCAAAANTTPELDGLDLEWVAVAGASFTMGDDGGRPAERPAHAVRVPAFSLARSETTTRDYRACVAAGACTEPRFERGNDLVPPAYCTWLATDREDHPINCIDWAQARAFCTWAGGRLPTEAEWELAARGGSRPVAYPWGDAAPSCERAVMGVPPHFVGCGEERTFPVCSRPAGNTLQGLCDMAGSLLEWVDDAGHDGYAGAPADGTAWVDGDAPATRVARGGSLATWDPAFLTTTVRFAFDPSVPRYVLGVRCAR
jgi:formylglycine-generating enzyme required for sulfatase activity